MLVININLWCYLDKSSWCYLGSRSVSGLQISYTEATQLRLIWPSLCLYPWFSSPYPQPPWGNFCCRSDLTDGTLVTGKWWCLTCCMSCRKTDPMNPLHPTLMGLHRTRTHCSSTPPLAWCILPSSPHKPNWGTAGGRWVPADWRLLRWAASLATAL